MPRRVRHVMRVSRFLVVTSTTRKTVTRESSGQRGAGTDRAGASQVQTLNCKGHDKKTAAGSRSRGQAARPREPMMPGPAAGPIE